MININQFYQIGSDLQRWPCICKSKDDASLLNRNENMSKYTSISISYSNKKDLQTLEI